MRFIPAANGNANRADAVADNATFRVNPKTQIPGSQEIPNWAWLSFESWRLFVCLGFGVSDLEPVVSPRVFDPEKVLALVCGHHKRIA
jgi:hypothetical protein